MTVKGYCRAALSAGIGYTLLCGVTVVAQPKVALKDTSTAAIAHSRLTALAIAVTPSALTQYAAQGDTAVVDLLLQTGVLVTSLEPKRLTTALHNAAAQGHIKVAQILLNTGAAVDAQDVNGATPLINAVYADQIELVKLLLRNKADTNIVPIRCPSALNLAVQRGNIRMVELLLDAGARVDLADNYGQTPQSTVQDLKRTEVINLIDKAASQ
jgi:uncharacterized protein